MLDCFQRRHHVSALSGQGHAVFIQVSLTEFSFTREVLITHDINTDVARETWAQKRPELARTAPDIHDHASAMFALVQSSCHHFIDGSFADAEALLRARLNVLNG